jgi:hypothetical protein
LDLHAIRRDEARVLQLLVLQSSLGVPHDSTTGETSREALLALLQSICLCLNCLSFCKRVVSLDLDLPDSISQRLHA